MIQRINLLRDGLEDRRVPWSAVQVTLGVAAVLLLLGLWASLLQWQLASVRSTVQVARSEIDSARSSVLELGRALQAHQPSSVLPQTIAETRLDLEGRRWLLATLRGQTASSAVQGFSTVLEGLGRQRVEAVWLTSIVVDQGGREIGLRGRAAVADALPEYLQRLGQEPAFTGRRFSLFELSRPPEDDPERGPELEFRLATGCAGPALAALCGDAAARAASGGRQ